MHATLPIPILGRTTQDLDSIARAIHSAYCECVANVDYDIFRGCWLRAAELAGVAEAYPRQYVEAQLRRHSELDPEDLASEEAVTTYRRFEFEQVKDLVDYYQYSESQMIGHASDNEGGMMLVLMFNLQATFLVVHAKLHYSDEDAARVLEIFGKKAAEELRSSKWFQECVCKMNPQLDMDALLGEIDSVAAKDAKCA